MTATKPHTNVTNIGRFARIRHKGQVLYGNVLDLIADSNKPKRIRIQRGNPALHGNVVMPVEYDFMGWADEEED